MVAELCEDPSPTMIEIDVLVEINNIVEPLNRARLVGRGFHPTSSKFYLTSFWFVQKYSVTPWFHHKSLFITTFRRSWVSIVLAIELSILLNHSAESVVEYIYIYIYNFIYLYIYSIYSIYL